MNQIVKSILPLLMVFLIVSCMNEEGESFAWGNFESEDILVPSEVNGIITEFWVREGQVLNPGDLIAAIDTVQLDLKRAQLIAARKGVQSGMTRLNAEIEVQNVKLENLEREFKRFGTLFLEEAATKKQMDDLEGQINLTKASITALESQKLTVYAEIETKNVQIAQINDQINRSLIQAPSNGHVLETFVKKGEMAVAGRSVVKMADLNNLILRVFVDGSQLSSIKTGDEVDVLYDRDKHIESVKGRVIWVSPEAEFTPKIIQTREERVNLVYAVKILVSNNGVLKIGMPAEIQLSSN